MTSTVADMADPGIAAIAAELGLDRPVVTVLAGGLVNRTLRLQDARQDVVLRFAGAQAAGLGVDRDSEGTMLRLAAAAGLAPELVVTRPQQGVLVTRHVAGHVLSRDDARAPQMLARIGEWLARLHALPLPAGLVPIDIAARAAGYLERLQAQASTPMLRDLAVRLGRIREELPPPRRLVPCHHDLHHLNLVDTGTRLVALDWEYAGPGDPAADLAACICYQDLDWRQQQLLLGAYGGDIRQFTNRLAPLCWVFDCLCHGWMELASLQGLAADPEQRSRLLARLMA